VGIPHVDVLLFVGVAVAWAVYLIPKAIQHHEHAERSRTVDRFSDRLRVLARREPVSKREAELVVTGAPVVPATSGPAYTTPVLPIVDRAAAPGPSAAEIRARRDRAAVRRATQRRRRVLGLLLVALAAVTASAAAGLLQWWSVTIPSGLLVAWLVACRVMVKGERRGARAGSSRGAAPADGPAAEEVLAMDETTEIARVVDAEPGMWDPVPVTLPTYVDKPAAARTVSSIDLESAGVWTSGHTAADSALARQADAAAAAERASSAAAPDEQRAAGA
jgi:hypothetical protein